MYSSLLTVRVKSGGQESSVGAVTGGVPQGSVLGPFLIIPLYWRRLEGYQVSLFSHLCGWFADLSHLWCVGLSKVYCTDVQTQFYG
jgi:hypothetical protein